MSHKLILGALLDALAHPLVLADDDAHERGVVMQRCCLNFKALFELKLGRYSAFFKRPVAQTTGLDKARWTGAGRWC